MVYQYTTHELVQSELRSTTPFGNSTSPSYDDVDEWISEESAYINTIANQVFGSTVYSSEFIDYDGEGALFLENAPVISVHSVHYNKQPLGVAPEWVAKVADTDYVFYKDRGIIKILFNNWSPLSGARRIAVTYSAGYVEPPLVVRKLATKLVAHRVLEASIAQNVNERSDGGSVSVGSVTIVEPANYGVSSFKQLKSDIVDLKAVVANTGFSIYRLGHI